MNNEQIIREMEIQIQTLRLEIAGLKKALTRPQYKFTEHPEKVVVDATRFTWN